MKNNFSKIIILALTLASSIIIYTCKELEKSMLVSTGDVTSITTNSADASGVIIDLGGGATQHGHCYGKSPNLTTSGSKTELGVPSGNGGFTSQLKNLEAGTLYYVKAYISDGAETAYGKEQSFTTSAPSLPSISTTTVASITSTTAISGGNITGDGGSPVTARGVCWNTSTGPSVINSKTTDGSGTGSFTSNLTGLVAGTTYYIRAYAANVAGTAYGNELTFTTSASTATVPGAPTIGTATAGNAQATVTFTPPANNGGSAITGYTVTSSPGNITGTGTASPITVTGLTNGTAYTFTVTATNAIGTGPASAASNSVTPSSGATVPGAPTIGTATAGNAQATVTFTAPASNGGSAITGYTVTSSPGNITGTGAASPIIVTGLTNGTTYTFTVTATNAIGTGPASAASNSVTPSTVPGAPTIGTATAGNAQATVTFTPPASNGGSAITGYTVTSSPGNITGTGAASPITVTGLTNGTAFTFTVTATNAVGIGPASAASNLVTPTTGFTVPGAPTIGTATKGNAQATITFTAPANNGGSAITGYTVTSSPGNITANGAASPIAVTGLTNGTAYTFTVTATNAIGTGPASSPSNSVTPSTVPGAPTIGTATAGNAQATVTFTAPASNGGSAITGYTVTSSPGNITGTGATSAITVTGLTNGTAYTFTVTATNANGTGPASSASNSVTPSTVPGAPTIGTATAGDAQASVSFTPPVSNGGSLITGYTATSNPGGMAGTGTASPITVAGLTNGTAYTFTVTATNANGLGPASAASNSVTPCKAPSATTEAASNKGTTTATLNGTVNANGLSTTVTFEWGLNTSYTGGTITATQSPVLGGTPLAVSAGLTGLTPNTLYHYRVKAVNCGGTVNGSDQTFSTLCLAPVGTSSSATSITSTTATLNGSVNPNGCITSVNFEYGLTTSYGSSIIAIQSPVTGSTTSAVSANITGLVPGTTYHFRIKAVNDGGTTYSSDLTFISSAVIPTLTTTPVTLITTSTASSGGNITSSGGASITARGVCWNTTGSPTIANSKTSNGTGTGAFSSSISGLTSFTTYYLRAYATNSVGTGYGNEITLTTSFTVTHTAGAVAPVTKTVTYGVVMTNLTNQDKLWLTQNLGADNQAFAASDATESAAGWYWQFNRKQGYKHDGTTRTPATAWITAINESSDWTAVNDPCTSLLGAGWRMPTYIEWDGCDYYGGWNNYGNTFTSALKIHAAGVLVNTNGSLYSLAPRGSYGYYWSTAQNGTVDGFYLGISSSLCYMTGLPKAFAATIRCLKD